MSLLRSLLFRVFAPVASVLALSACLSDKAVVPAVPETCDSLRGITYTKDIKPILDVNCNTVGCHNANDFRSAGGYNFSTYSAASKNVNLDPEKFFCAIRRGSGCLPMPRGAAKLSDCDINRLQAWADSGFAE